MRIQSLVVAIFLFLSIVFPPISFAKDKSENAIGFEILVIPEARRHVEWLEYPSYLAVALENNGLNPDSTGIMVIRDGKSLKVVDKFTINYIGESSNRYFYSVLVDFPIGGTFEVGVEIDTSAINSGKVLVDVTFPLSEYFVGNYKERVAQKFSRLTDAVMQKKLSDYLYGIDIKLDFSKRMQDKFELLMIDAYNRRTSNIDIISADKPMGVEPVSEKLLLISSLAILLFTIFLRLAVIFYKNIFRRSRG